MTTGVTTDPSMNWVNYNGQQTIGAGNPFFTDMLNQATQAHNSVLGTNLTSQQMDAQLNPTTYGARYGVPASSMSAPASSSGGYAMPTSNPYTGGMADSITNQSQNFVNNALNQINSGAVAVGGMGGSRQGLAQGTAIAQGENMLSGNLANLYGGLYTGDQNRNLQQQQITNGYNLGLGNLDLNSTVAGASLYGLGTQGAWSPYQNFGSTLSPWSGYGTTTGTSQQGGGAAGALGGLISGGSYAANRGWW